jgi:hypothetical protein
MKSGKIKIFLSTLTLISSGMAGVFFVNHKNFNLSNRQTLKRKNPVVVNVTPVPPNPSPIIDPPNPNPEPTAPAPVVVDFCSDSSKQQICSEKSMVGNLEKSVYPGLAKLKLYQDICQSNPFSSEMVFINFPLTKSEAESYALDVAQILKEFAADKIDPVIVFEPIGSSGNVNFTNIAEGKYKSVLDYYFQKISEQGIDSVTIGTWLPYPEANTPAFGQKSFLPADFSKMVNSFVDSYRSKFSTGKVGILLDSRSYAPGDTNWSSGQLVSFSPYLTGIKNSAIDIFYLQGFPWAPTKSEKEMASSLDPNEYLPDVILKEAAQILGTKKIALHTGTYRKKYRTSGETITMTSAERKKILDDTLTIAENLKQQDYQPTISLFAENKFNDGEETDWSYLGNSADETVLKNFLRQAGCLGVNMVLYDY